MKIESINVEDYINKVPEDKKEAIINLRQSILKNLPPGFEEGICYNMIGYFVPLSTYPSGYHCTPNTPLPFVSIAAQKNFVALYHMGIYSDENLLNWFQSEFSKNSSQKLDMGKSCIRFKKVDQIPLELIGELMTKIKPNEWIEKYEMLYNQKTKKK